MPTNAHLILARYTYDPLDRLTHCSPSEQPYIQRYYCKTRLSTEIQGTTHRSILQHEDQLLAQHHRDGAATSTALLLTDLQRSLHHAIHGNLPYVFAYTPYGHRPLTNGVLDLLGFNGETMDPVTGYYHLGNGYREYNPVLMRFNGPDSWSPFGAGGLNAYAYCAGDPINNRDPSGHGLKSILRVNRPPVPPRSRKAPLITSEDTAGVAAVEPETPIQRKLFDFPHFTSKTRSNTLSNASTLLHEEEAVTLIDDIKTTAAQRYAGPTASFNYMDYKTERINNKKKLMEFHNKKNATEKLPKLPVRRIRLGSEHIQRFDKIDGEFLGEVKIRPIAQFRQSVPE
ncbi:RHS repeat-associated core domain-containing protein [Pseudomonas sp. LB3P31]